MMHPHTYCCLRLNLVFGISLCRSIIGLFAGLGLKEELLRAALDECLVTVAEAEGAGFSGLPDPFEPWPDVADLVDMGEL